MSSREIFAAVLITASLAMCGGGAAQPARLPPEQETPAERRRLYADETRQLAQVLGSAHYLRVLCVGRSDQTWRQFMRGLLEKETAVRRAALIDAFNIGYRSVEERFPSCSPTATAEEAELKALGLRLADTLSARNRD